MLELTVDRYRINKNFKATVTVQSDSPVTAYEARATVSGEAYGRGIGLCLLSDDTTAENGVTELAESVTSFTFDVESSELDTDGEYRISVFVRDENGVWNDCCNLFTSASEAVVDSEGAYVLAKRSGSGTDETYVSAYSGEDIDNFITEVLS